MPSLIPLDNVLGATYIGIIFSTAIYGITCLQVYLYYTEHSENDGRFLKTFVAVIMTIDTLHVMLVSVVYYHYTVTNFGDYTVLAKTTSLCSQVTVGAFLSLLVQWFFAYRVYFLSGRRWIIPSLICLLSLAQMITGGILYVIKGVQVVFFGNFSPELPFTTTALALDLACDSLIAVTMIYYLRRGRTNLTARTSRAIRLLIIYTMNTCFLTTMCTFACLVSWLASTSTLIYAPFFFVLVRLYSCSLMTTLNTRATVRQKLSEGGVISLSAFKATSGPSAEQTSETATTTGGQAYGGEDTLNKPDSVKKYAGYVDGSDRV
ncbi:hypothetical protein OF83DRAFT_201820 [Amylostereum chailletii]|nr:hypothetical protein OF83DRAFT_201820 [Amylostereum chailletii]